MIESTIASYSVSGSIPEQFSASIALDKLAKSAMISTTLLPSSMSLATLNKS